jgi:multidrug efflux pump subunit AcrA (membrane-fusion protein)
MVLRRLVETGQHVMPGQPLLLVGSAETVVHVQVIEEDLARGVRVGMPALLVQDGNDAIPARVIEIAPVTMAGSRVFTVKVRPDRNASLTARHGSSVPVRFLLAERKDVLALPVHALVGDRPDAVVFLVRGDRAIRQPVRTGIEEDGWIEASFSWNGKDAVATSNLGSLSDSTRVFGVPEREETR